MTSVSPSTWSSTLFLFSPMVALVLTMLAIVGVPLVSGRNPRTVAGIVGVGLVAVFLLSLRVFQIVDGAGSQGFLAGPDAGILLVDNLSAAFQVILVVVLGAVFWLWCLGSLDGEANAPEFFILLLGSALGMALMASTSNLLMIVMAIEAASLPSYAIVGFDKKDRRGAEASLKYMVFGAVCAAIMVYGASLIYGLVGSLDFAVIAERCAGGLGGSRDRLLLSLGLVCFFAGVAFKISAVPFHFWCPDAFEGARIEVTTWLSVASKAAGLVLLIRLVAMINEAVDVPAAMNLVQPMAWAIGVCAAVTCTVGNFSAYRQTSVKRLLAYSSIAHAGYMMMAAAVFLHPTVAQHRMGILALVAYLVIYVFMNLGAFGVTAMVVWRTGSDDLHSFTGLIRRAPWLAVPMVVCLMSLVGLPPLAGFIGKWWLLVALGTSGDLLGWGLVVVAVANTLFSLYYYLRVVVQMVLRDSGEPVMSVPFSGLVFTNLCATLLLVLFLAGQPLRDAAERSTRNLFNQSAVEARAAGNSSSSNPSIPGPRAGEVSVTSIIPGARP